VDDHRWLITGARGQLGADLSHVLRAAGVPPESLLAVGSAELDITDRTALAETFAAFAPDIVINAAAYTAVDQAETDVERAYAVNATGAALVAAEAARSGSRIVHVSTDYVFPGDAEQPYEVDAVTGPHSTYGRTKLAGEVAVRELAPKTGFVVRTSWVYGANGPNFVRSMTALERSRDTISVVDDQRGSPTWSADLARGLVELARSNSAPGVYHCTNAEDTTWYGFARAIFAELGADPDRVLPTTSDKFPRPAPRPAYSVLSARSWLDAGLTPMPGWREALREAFATVGDQLRASAG
jgi:dTDP-4-dehydrorhamnose reductase